MQLDEDKFEYVSGTSYAIKQLLIIYACTIPLTVISFIMSYFTQFTIADMVSHPEIFPVIPKPEWKPFL